MKITLAKCFAAFIGIGVFVANTYYFDPADFTYSLMGYGMCFLALFLYLNPAILIARSRKERDDLWANPKGLPLVWIGLAIAVVDFLNRYF
jgi:hypothetical protein